MGAFTVGTNGEKAACPRSTLGASSTTTLLFLAEAVAARHGEPHGTATGTVLRLWHQASGLTRWGGDGAVGRTKNPGSTEALRKDTGWHPRTAALCFPADLLLPLTLTMKSHSLRRALQTPWASFI